MIIESIPLIISFLFCQHSFWNQLFPLHGVEIRSLPDFLLHKWLCELWSINFIVSIPSVPDDVNYNIPLELYPLFKSCFEGILHFNRLFCIHVDDRAVNALGQTGRIQSMSVIARCSCEPDLVVDNNVNCSPSREITQVAHLKHFIIYALTLEGCVPVKNYWNMFVSVILEQILLGNFYFLSCSHITFHNWIDGV